MNRRHLITLLGCAAAACPLAACAQKGGGRAAALVARILQLRADSLADDMSQFFGEIVSQMGWITHLTWSVGTMEQRRFDALRLLRQVPAISEITFLDASGIDQLNVSRLAMDYLGPRYKGSSPEFLKAMADKIYYGPVHLRRESYPYMTLSLAGTQREGGVSVAEVNVTRVRDLVVQLKVGEHGTAYVLDAQGRVIAHPDINPRLFQADLSDLPQVRAALAADAGPPEVRAGLDIKGRDVLSASASVAGPGWRVFVELPLAEADATIP